MAKSIGYFAGANGERGFVGYFSDAIDRTRRTYILKGGCGCGKSALMKKVAAAAEDCGEGVERLYCASDPESLDGVIIPALKLGIADGTAPHELSPRMPGAADELINLGEFWDSAFLRRRREEIKVLSKQKESAMHRAYDLLAAAGCLRNEKHRLLEGAVLWDKMAAAAERIVKKTAPPGKEFCATVRLRSAFCSKGTVNAPDYGEEHTVPVKDPYGIAHLFYEQLLTAAYGRGLRVTVSPDPLSPLRIGAIMIDDTGTLFAATAADAKPVNMERFVDKNKLHAVNGKLKLINKFIKSLEEEGRQAMQESRKAHATLEKIYTPAMDFEKVDAVTKRIIADILE